MAMQYQHRVTQASRYSENGECVALHPVQKCCAMQQRARAQWVRKGHRAAKASASRMGQTKLPSHASALCKNTFKRFTLTRVQFAYSAQCASSVATGTASNACGSSPATAQKLLKHRTKQQSPPKQREHRARHTTLHHNPNQQRTCKHPRPVVLQAGGAY